MDKPNHRDDFDRDFQHDAKCMLDACDDPDCVFCQASDADAAFWDEFYADPESELEDESDMSLHLIDENSGEELDFHNLNITAYTFIRQD